MYSRAERDMVCHVSPPPLLTSDSSPPLECPPSCTVQSGALSFSAGTRRAHRCLSLHPSLIGRWFLELLCSREGCLSTPCSWESGASISPCDQRHRQLASGISLPRDGRTALLFTIRRGRPCHQVGNHVVIDGIQRRLLSLPRGLYHC